MTITPLDIYLINIADKVIVPAAFVAVCSFIAFCISVFLLFLACESESDDKKCKLIVKSSATVLVVSSLLSIFVPSTRTLATMYVLPAIVNNEHIQNSTGNALEALENLTKEWLKNSLNNNVKKEKEI